MYHSNVSLEGMIGNYKTNHISSFCSSQTPSVPAYSCAIDDVLKPVYSISSEGVDRKCYEITWTSSKPYTSKTYSMHQSSTAGITQTYVFEPNLFLKPCRELTQFIGSAEEVRPFVEQAFEKLTGRKFPADIVVNVLDYDDLKLAHSRFGKWSSGIQGFAINRKDESMPSEIFVKSGSLDMMMCVLGHEIGHVYAKRVADIHDEEAKAMAFNIAWNEVIKENNIGELANSLNPGLPAANGLHDVSFRFVLDQLTSGISAMGLFWKIMNGEIKCKNWLNVCFA